MGRMPASRREARSSRITAAIALLGAASLMMAGALAVGSTFVVGAAGVFAVAMGWTALRLAWTAVLASRYEHAVDRTELARAYRALFAERAVETASFVGTMSDRLAQRDQALHAIEGTVVGIEMRAIEAEASARTAERRLSETTFQLSAMEHLITTQLEEQEQQAARLRELEANEAHPLLGRRPTPEQRPVAPEWAALERDPIDALMAWERHADQVNQGREAEAARDRRSGA
ncbi:MAG: putative multidomain rane protein [Nocardioidaceae bacterium]|nr:putative multidomain rane protein [Nocardioidaceae bacterium]